MADKGFTASQVEGLVSKLNSLDLTDDEKGLLSAIFRAAADSEEVAGFHQTTIGTAAQAAAAGAKWLTFTVFDPAPTKGGTIPTPQQR